MTAFLQACGAVLLAVILILAQGDNRQWVTVLTLVACCMVMAVAMGYLRPVMDFLRQLEAFGNLDSTMVEALLKIAGIGLLSEISSLICADAGNAVLGKTVQLLGTAVMLWLSVPLLTAMLELLRRILGES